MQLTFFILRVKEEGRERRLKPKSEIRNEREIETERDERRMIERTARAGEQRKATNEGWEGENNDKKGNKKI